MTEVNFTLLSDGSSDRALIPVIKWTLLQHFPEISTQGERANLGRLPKPPRLLRDRITAAIELYPCDILFVHRDAERLSLEERECEIDEVWNSLNDISLGCKLIKIIPVRMTEAWLMIDEQAIKNAAANPNFPIDLSLPLLKNLEQLADPKETLYNLIENATGVTGRKLRSRNIPQAVHLVSEYIEDFSPLRSLASFQYFENQIRSISLQ